MKRGIPGKLILVLLILALTIPLCAHADQLQIYPDDLENLHVHSWSEWRTEQAAGCTSGGLEVRECSSCGTMERRETGAKGHQPQTVSGYAATCETGGKTDGSVCSVCGAELEPQKDIPATGHSWDGGAVTTAATCTQEGVRTFTCANCGATRTEAIPATGQHSWDGGAVTTAATCTGEGVRTFTCANCGATRTEAIPATGQHSWDGGNVTTAPGCETAGVRTYTCTVCGSTYTEPIAATGHKPEELAAVAATCENPGKTEGKKCSVCGEILEKQQEIPAKGHDWGPWKEGSEPTCETKGKDYSVCANCGQTRYRDIREALGHDWDEGVVTKEATVTEDGEITYTCKRDPSHTKTEIIPAGGTSTLKGGESPVSLFSNLRNIPANLPDDALVITEHPQGGTDPADGSGLYLSVAAKGGVKPYTYEWHYRDLDSTGNALNKWYQEKAQAIADDYNKKKNSSAVAFANAFHELYPAATFSYTKPTYSFDGKLAEELTCVLDPTDKTLGTYSAPQVAAFGHCEFWCIVTDAAGNKARSDSAEVFKPLAVDIQPQDTNMLGQKSVELECVAKGGVAPYSYQWFNAEGKSMGVGETLTSISISETGEYFCMVLDRENAVYSEIVKVYDAEPFAVIPVREAYTIPKETGYAGVQMTIQGGLKPYTCDWLLNEEQELSLFTTEANLMEWIAKEPGTYTLLVMDATGTIMSGESKVTAEKQNTPNETKKGLRITQQPKAIRITGGKLRISCKARAGDGNNSQLVYKWYKYKNGKWKFIKYGSKFTTKEGGKYYCKVIDRRTGEEVKSKTLTAKIKMKFVSAKRKGKKLTIKFKNGVSPFMIKIYKKTNSGYKFYKQVKLVSNSTKVNHKRTVQVPKKKVKYKIVIKDSGGHSCEGYSKK